MEKVEKFDLIIQMSTQFLLTQLSEMHSEKAGWIFLPELRVATGYSETEQRLDAWAIHAWPSKNNLRRAFEIKISEGDVYKELCNPDKRWRAYSLSHEFYFVAPQGLIPHQYLAKDDGLIEWVNDKLIITKKARTRETMPPRWDFVASLARRIMKKEIINELDYRGRRE